MAGLPGSLAIAIWFVAALWVVGAVAYYFDYSAEFIWLTLFLGMGVALAEWCLTGIAMTPELEDRNKLRVTSMLSEPLRIANAREHNSWSRQFALLWLALSLAVFGGAYALAEASEMSNTNRTLMFVMLGTIILTNAVWQAAGLALTRLENLILPRFEARGSHD